MSLDSPLSRIFRQNSSPARAVPISIFPSQSLPTTVPQSTESTTDLASQNSRSHSAGTTIRIGPKPNSARTPKDKSKHSQQYEAKPLEERSLAEAFPGLLVDDPIPVSFQRPSKAKHDTAKHHSTESLESMFDGSDDIQLSFPAVHVKHTKPVPLPCYQRLETDSERPSVSNERDVEQKRDPVYIKHQKATDYELNAQTEYDMDTQDKLWLDRLNAKNRTVETRGSEEDGESVDDYTFEFIMDRLEKEWFDLSKDVVNRHRDLPEEDANCAICNIGDCENVNGIVYCDGCNLAVHQDCYGVPFIPEGQWLCRKCMVSPDHPVGCLLCPSTTGAFKQTPTGKWAHSLCALWIPEASVGNTATMEPLILTTIPKSRFKLTCYICEDKTGACIQCTHKNCFVAFHVTCARAAGLQMDVRVVQKDDVSEDGSDSNACEMNAFCHKHSKKEEGVNILANIDRIKNSNRFGTVARGTITTRQDTKYVKPITPVIPNYIFDKIMEGERVDEGQSVGKEAFAREVCRYWSLKRKMRRGAPLLRRLHLEPWTAKTVQSEASLQLDLEKYTLQSTFKHPLATLLSLQEFIKQREKKRLVQVKIMHKYFLQFTQPLVGVLNQCLKEILRSDGKNVFWGKVDVELVSDYLTYIKIPMEFETVQMRVDGGAYHSLESFEADVMQVVTNAKLYNLPETFYHKAALKVEKQAQLSIAKASLTLKGMNTDPTTGFVTGVFDDSMIQFGEDEEVEKVVEEVGVQVPVVAVKRSASRSASKRKRVRKSGSVSTTRDTSPEQSRFLEYEMPLNDTPQYKNTKHPSPSSLSSLASLTAFSFSHTTPVGLAQSPQRTTRQNTSITREMDTENLAIVGVLEVKGDRRGGAPRKPSKREVAKKRKDERNAKRRSDGLGEAGQEDKGDDVSRETSDGEMDDSMVMVSVLEEKRKPRDRTRSTKAHTSSVAGENGAVKRSDGRHASGRFIKGRKAEGTFSSSQPSSPRLNQRKPISHNPTPKPTQRQAALGSQLKQSIGRGQTSNHQDRLSAEEEESLRSIYAVEDDRRNTRSNNPFAFTHPYPELFELKFEESVKNVMKGKVDKK